MAEIDPKVRACDFLNQLGDESRYPIVVYRFIEVGRQQQDATALAFDRMADSIPPAIIASNRSIRSEADRDCPSDVVPKRARPLTPLFRRSVPKRIARSAAGRPKPSKGVIMGTTSPEKGDFID